MSDLDVMTALLMKLLSVDPLNVPSPVRLLGFSMTVMFTTFLVWMVWYILRSVFNTTADVLDISTSKQSVVIARGLTRHDFEQMRKGIRNWNLLLVRYGSDDYLRNMAGESDRQAGRTRYQIIRMKLALSPTGEVSLSWALPVHRRLGTQFRCFIDIRGTGAGSDVLTGMLSHYDEIDVLPSDVPQPTRVYFLLKRFRSLASADGSRHNFALPE